MHDNITIVENSMSIRDKVKLHYINASKLHFTSQSCNDVDLNPL